MFNKEKQTTHSPADHKDLLLECLSYLTSYFNNTKSRHTLAAGFAIGANGVDIKTFCKIAEQAQYQTKIIERRLKDIPHEVYPIIAFIKPATPIVIIEKKDSDTYKVYNPENNQTVEEKKSELEKKVTDYFIYIKPKKLSTQYTTVDYKNHWFWGSLIESKAVYKQILIASLLINIFALASPIFMMNFYNRVIPNNALETGWVLAIGVTSVFIFDYIIKMLRSYFIDIVQRRSDVVAAEKLYRQVLNMRLGVRKGSIGSFANSLKEFDSLREFFNSATLTGLVDFPFSALFIVVIWIIAGTQIALLLLLMYVVVIIVGYFIQIPVRQHVQEALKTADLKHGLLVETISSLETIKGVSGEGKLRYDYANYVDAAAEAGQHSRHYSSLTMYFSGFIQQFSSVLIMLLGMYLVQEKAMTMGALIASVMLASRAIAPVGTIAGLINKYHQAKSAYVHLDDIMQLPVERETTKNYLHRDKLNGDFQFKNVSFKYPDTQNDALKNITLSVKAGEKIAIVGRIGSGKSTLVKMLVNFYQPSEGAIFVDGTDMRQIDPADLRHHVAYMGQDTTLMSGTVRSNIIMGRPSAADSDIIHAAEISGTHDFMRHHPMGYDAPLAEQGRGLSDGQKQTVALARTLLMNTSVVILDEPTASMDAGTEEKILRNLEGALQNKTLIIVTHKPALLRLINRLIVIDNGVIAMDGPRDQVLQALASGQVGAVPA